MNMSYLNTAEDMAWLNEVHGVPATMKCAILYGNEGCPDKIEAWTVRNPQWDATPDYHFDRADALDE